MKKILKLHSKLITDLSMTKETVTLNHYTLEPKNGAKPTSIVVVLHGYGSNGRDLISLAPYWQDAVPNAVFVSPDAHQPHEGGAPGGFQWFSLATYNQEFMTKGASEAQPILDTYLDSLLMHYGLTDDRLALCGFSQGCMMSLYCGPRRKNKIAGILGYSGALVGEEGLKDAQKPPVHLIHGQDDSVVPVVAHRHATAHLVKNGFEVSGYTTPGLEHSIDEKGIESGAEFLNEILR